MLLHRTILLASAMLTAQATTCSTEALMGGDLVSTKLFLDSESTVAFMPNINFSGVCQVLLGMLILHILLFRYKPTFTSEFILYLIIVAVNITCFEHLYAASTLVETISHYAPSQYFIGFCIILDVVFTFINVIPKYINFSGAERHKNEMFVKKSYMTKNYLRLFMHILSGILGYATTGYVWYVNGNISSNFKNAVMFIDVVHEITAWLMIRNHDGAMSLRAGNLGFTVLKQVAVASLFHTNDPQKIKSLCTFMFTFTSGFAWTRFNCSIILILSIYGKGDSFDSLRENWYTFGESSAQVIIAFAAGVHGELNLAHAVAFWYFPHENWVSRRNKHYQQGARILGVVLVLYYFLVPRSYYMTHVTIYHLVVYFTYQHCGAFFKRNPLPKVDFKTDIEKEIALKNSKVKDENFQQKLIAKVFSGEAGAPKSSDEKKRTPESSEKEVKVSLPTKQPEVIVPKKEAEADSSTEVEFLRARINELESQLAGRIAFLEQHIMNRTENMNTPVGVDPALPVLTLSPSNSPIHSNWELSLSDAETASLELIKAVSRATQATNPPNKRLITLDDTKDGDGLDSDYVAPANHMLAVPVSLDRQASMELLKKKSSLLMKEQISLKLNGHTESSYILFVQNSASRQVSGGF